MKPNVVFTIPAQDGSSTEERPALPPSFPYAFGRFDKIPSVTVNDLAPDILIRRFSDRSIKNPGMELARVLDLQGRLVLWHATLGTPWGYFLFRALQTQSRIIQNGLLRVVSLDPQLTVRLPLMSWYETDLKNSGRDSKEDLEKSQAIQTLVKTLKTWDAFELAIGVLVGYKQARIKDLASPLKALSKWLGAEKDFILDIGREGERPACPMVAGNPMGLGSMLGGLARVCIQSTTFDLESKGIKLPSAAIYKASAGEAASLTLFKWGLEQGPARAKEHYPSFMAALWLSLWTPLHPRFAPSRKRADWLSLHPGYRLSRLAEVIQSQKIFLRSFDPSDIHSFWDQLCAILDWPTPRAMARNVMSLASQDALDERFRVACQVQDKNPAALLRPGLDPVLTAPLLPYLIRMHHAADDESDSALWFAIEAELYAISYALLFSPTPPTTAIPISNEEMDLIGTPEELARNYFGLRLS